MLHHLPEAIRLTHTRFGLMLYPAGDTYIGPCLETYGEYSPEEAQIFSLLLKPGDSVLEVGANIGAHTLALSAFVGPAGRVHTIEPQRLVFQMLCANLALNNLSNVDARRLGLGAAPHTLWTSLTDMAAQGNFGGLPLASEGKEAIEIVTLDSLALTKLDLIKIDVEGMEDAVLHGGQETIRRLKPPIYIENDRAFTGDAGAETSVQLIRLIRDFGYRLWWHTPELTSRTNYRGVTTELFSRRTVSVNMICFPANEAIDTNLTEVGADTDKPNLDALLPGPLYCRRMAAT
ncbi:FkbM family methyltransferase [Acidisoma silvae]|uniref:FkbM family methyltransferase n=1 Tax=Acidisoma silvae TaxID=2802396 RepID=A0A964E030_9PROT|nr:FkbM family methyltransferase [Acidisoma silvae]MCB8876737.1 FkbM family methyltransferase [Acidisoma silvae]